VPPVDAAALHRLCFYV